MSFQGCKQQCCLDVCKKCTFFKRVQMCIFFLDVKSTTIVPPYLFNHLFKTKHGGCLPVCFIDVIMAYFGTICYISNVINRNDKLEMLQYYDRLKRIWKHLSNQFQIELDAAKNQLNYLQAFEKQICLGLSCLDIMNNHHRAYQEVNEYESLKQFNDSKFKNQVELQFNRVYSSYMSMDIMEWKNICMGHSLLYLNERDELFNNMLNEKKIKESTIQSRDVC